MNHVPWQFSSKNLKINTIQNEYTRIHIHTHIYSQTACSGNVHWDMNMISVHIRHTIRK
jgi:hypothetical protein